MVPELKKESLTSEQAEFFKKKQQVYITHRRFLSTHEISLFNCPSSVGITNSDSDNLLGQA